MKLVTMKKITVFISTLFIMSNIKSQKAIGVFQNQITIGNAKQGSAAYNTQTQEYTIEGSGNNVWFNHDGFQYLSRQLKGDFILRCNASFIGKGVEAHRKFGWMI